VVQIFLDEEQVFSFSILEIDLAFTATSIAQRQNPEPFHYAVPAVTLMFKVCLHETLTIFWLHMQKFHILFNFCFCYKFWLFI
jgi:hypothetical protein